MLSITKAELSLADAYKRKGVYLPFFSKKKKKKKMQRIVCFFRRI